MCKFEFKTYKQKKETVETFAWFYHVCHALSLQRMRKSNYPVWYQKGHFLG